jgi:hypothetical protein
MTNCGQAYSFPFGVFIDDKGKRNKMMMRKIIAKNECTVPFLTFGVKNVLKFMSLLFSSKTTST